MPPLSVLKPAPKAHNTHRPAVMTASHVENQSLSMGLLNRYQKKPSKPTEKKVEMTPQVMAQAMLRREYRHLRNHMALVCRSPERKKNFCRRRVNFYLFSFRVFWNTIIYFYSVFEMNVKMQTDCQSSCRSPRQLDCHIHPPRLKTRSRMQQLIPPSWR